MTKVDFGFIPFEYSLVLVVIGMILGMFLRLSEEGWPEPRKRWAYPLMFACFGVLVITSVVRFIQFVVEYHK